MAELQPVENPMIPQSRIDRHTGRVAVWDLIEERWRKIHPVDAKEQMRAGSVTLEGPTEPPGHVGEPPKAVHIPEESEPIDAGEPVDFPKARGRRRN
jgi:hypothetical protein